MNPTESHLSADDIIAALSDKQRRTLLVSLLKHAPEVDATCVVVEIDADSRMHHHHLPRLAEYGLITWNEGTRVTKGPNFEEAEQLLQLFADNDVASSPNETGV